MPKGGIDRNAIKRIMKDIQREFDKNGPIQVPVGVDATPSLVGEMVPGVGPVTFGDPVM